MMTNNFQGIQDITSNSVSQFLKAVTNNSHLASLLVHHQILKQRDVVYQDPHPPLPPPLEKALNHLGIQKLYSHQAEALKLVRQGENVVAITPTASGKSLLFNLPILEALINNPNHSALYIYPLKALEQDQYQRLTQLIHFSGFSSHIKIGIYDGDTPEAERKKLKREPPHILITNPDMLHLGIIAYTKDWGDFLRRLKWIVVDELHIYRGVFGSHFLWILHRLQRICQEFNSHLQFITTSATIANAQQLAEKITGQKFKVIERSGAFSPQRHFLFFNPSLQESYITTTLNLLLIALEVGLKTIVFTRARQTTERLYLMLKENAPQWADRVSSYRAGFLPEERRRIEAGLLSGKLDGVISTSALELGIDVGGLDLCILAGYPGTVAATWQRAGRVGRGQLPAAIALVAGEDQLDQYFARNPHDFFSRPVEEAIVDPTNEYIARNHLLCAACEVPIRENEPILNETSVKELVTKLTAEGKLLQSASGDQWFSNIDRPHRLVDIRSAGEQFAILSATGETIGTISGRQIYSECYPGAIYLHRGEQNLVEELDLKARRVLVRSVQVDYFTRPLIEKETEVIDELKRKSLPDGEVVLARLKVEERVVGYQRRLLFSQEILSSHPLNLPPITYQTLGFYLKVPERMEAQIQELKLHFQGGLHGTEHAMLGLAPLFALCDRQDLGGISLAYHHQVKGPAIFIYDGFPGGIGLSDRLFEVVADLINRTAHLIRTCHCEGGCPSCIHSPKCGHGNVPLDKKAALLICETLLGISDNKIRENISFSTSPISYDLKPSLADLKVNLSRKPILSPPPPAPPLPEVWPRDKRGGVLDIETQRCADEVGGWKNASQMGLAYASLYLFPEDRWIDIWEEDIEDLFMELTNLDLIVGFNIVNFDFIVLSPYLREINQQKFSLPGLHLKSLPSYDIHQHIYHYLSKKVSLSDIAMGTLGVGKSANGLQSLEWWKRGEYEKVATYCRQDVALTRDIFYHILNKGYVLYHKRDFGLVRIPLPSPLEFLKATD